MRLHLQDGFVTITFVSKNVASNSDISVNFIVELSKK